MNRLNKITVGVCAALYSCSVLSLELGMSLAEESIDLDYSGHIIRDNQFLLGQSQLFYRENNTGYFMAGFIMKSPDYLNQKMHYSFGTRLYGIKMSHQLRGSNIAVGGDLNITPINDLDIDFTIYYSPTIVSFGDSDRFIDSSASLNLQIQPNVKVSLGYRRADIWSGDKNHQIFNESGYIGMKFLF